MRLWSLSLLTVLIPIDRLFDYYKQALRQYPPTRTTVFQPEFTEKMDSSIQTSLKRRINSMPIGIRAVITAPCGHTRNQFLTIFLSFSHFNLLLRPCVHGFVVFMHNSITYSAKKKFYQKLAINKMTLHKLIHGILTELKEVFIRDQNFW